MAAVWTLRIVWVEPGSRRPLHLTVSDADDAWNRVWLLATYREFLVDRRLLPSGHRKPKVWLEEQNADGDWDVVDLDEPLAELLDMGAVPDDDGEDG